MKGKTSEWLSTLTLRTLKDLVNLLFDAEHKLQGHRHLWLFTELLRRIDDEYHAHKRG